MFNRNNKGNKKIHTYTHTIFNSHLEFDLNKQNIKRKYKKKRKYETLNNVYEKPKLTTPPPPQVKVNLMLYINSQIYLFPPFTLSLSLTLFIK